MDHPLPDVWFTRDLPVLRAIARLVDEPKHGGAPYLLGSVVPASGLPKAAPIRVQTSRFCLPSFTPGFFTTK